MSQLMRKQQDASEIVERVDGIISYVKNGVITGNDTEEQIDEFIKSGAKKVFIKPLSNENLEVILKKYYRKIEWIIFL